MQYLWETIKRSFTSEQAKSWAKTMLTSFVAAALTLAVAQFQSGQALDYKAIVAAGAVGVLTAVINWLNPADNRYGLGS